MTTPLPNFYDCSDEYDAQLRLAARLRALAIKHLTESKAVVASSFRGESLNAGIEYKSFLRKQAKNGEWGTYIEAAALGEAYGVNVVVTSISRNQEQKPFCIYRAADPKAPTVHLYNSSNCHWHYHRDGGKTRGDGNCLYNAFAQALYYQSKPTVAEAPIVAPVVAKKMEPEKKPVEKKASLVSVTNLFTSVESEVIKHQKAIRGAIANATTPVVMKSDYDAEVARVNALSKAERDQIARDHQLALELARSDMMAYKNPTNFRRSQGADNKSALKSW